MRKIKTDKKILKRLSGVIFSKSFLGAVFFASGLWVYTALNQEYRTNLNIPIKFVLPESRTFVKAPPENITINVRGTGWHLLNTQSAFCLVDLSKDRTKDTVYKINRDILMKNIQNQNYLSVIDIYPDNFNLLTGKLVDVPVQLVPNVEIKTMPGYEIVGKVKIKPDVIMISGDAGIINKIDHWVTKHYVFENVNSPINTYLELSDSLRGIVKVKEGTFRLVVDIQQIAEMVVPDVKVKITGANLMKDHQIGPAYLKVTVRGGINLIKQLNPEDIKAYIDYQQVLNDSTGYLAPVVKVPENIKVISVSPKYLYHKIRK